MAASARHRTWRACCSPPRRRKADAGGLSRHRTGDERPDRRPCRFLLRAVGQRDEPVKAGGSRPMRFPPRSGWRRCRMCRPRRKLGVDYQMSIWAGSSRPRARRPTIVARLADALDKALDDPLARAAVDPARRLDPGQGRAQSGGVRHTYVQAEIDTLGAGAEGDGREPIKWRAIPALRRPPSPDRPIWRSRLG